MAIERRYHGVAEGLMRCGAVKFGKFKLKLHERHPEAPLSPIYIDLRVVRSLADLLDAVANVFADLARDLEFDIYAEVPTAVTPIVSVLVHKTRVPMVSPRRGPKTHGLPRKVEGLFQEGQTALLVDDLITQADSKLEAIAILEENGLVVRDVAVLLDRQQGGRERLQEKGCSLHSAFNLTDLLTFYLETGTIDQNSFNEVRAYIESDVTY